MWKQFNLSLDVRIQKKNLTPNCLLSRAWQRRALFFPICWARGVEFISVAFEYYLSGKGWIKNNWLLFFTRFNETIRCKKLITRETEKSQASGAHKNVTIAKYRLISGVKSSSETSGKSKNLLDMTWREMLLSESKHIIRDLQYVPGDERGKIKLIW